MWSFAFHFMWIFTISWIDLKESESSVSWEFFAAPPVTWIFYMEKIDWIASFMSLLTLSYFGAPSQPFPAHHHHHHHTASTHLSWCLWIKYQLENVFSSSIFRWMRWEANDEVEFILLPLWLVVLFSNFWFSSNNDKADNNRELKR